MPSDEPDPSSPAVERVRTRDGRALHLERRGDGSPTVVFEAGTGASSAIHRARPGRRGGPPRRRPDIGHPTRPTIPETTP